MHILECFSPDCEVEEDGLKTKAQKKHKRQKLKLTTENEYRRPKQLSYKLQNTNYKTRNKNTSKIFQ